MKNDPVPTKWRLVSTVGLALIVWMSVGLVSLAQGPTCTVSSVNDSGAGTLRQCLIDVDAGGTVNFQLTYPATIILSSNALTVEKNITINGPGASNLTINGNNTHRLFLITDDATISDLTLQNGTDATFGGGAIWNTSPITLTNMVVSGNTAKTGGAIRSYATMMISNTQFISNTSTGQEDWNWNGGGAILAEGDDIAMTVVNSVFQQNRTLGYHPNYPDAGLYGGALATNGVLTITNTEFISNSTTGGGTLYVDNEAIIANSLFQGNYAGGYSGAIYADSILTLTNSRFISNTATETSGAIYVYGEAVINDSLFEKNRAGTYAGAIYTDDVLTLTNSIFRENHANEYGGAMEAYSTAFISNTQFISNTATEDSGAIYTENTAEINNCQFWGNHAGDYAGAMSTSGSLTITNSIFRQNSTNTYGGVLYTDNELTITNTQFISNTAAENAGAIYADTSSSIEISGGLFQENKAGTYAGALETYHILTISDTQFLTNTAVLSSGAIYASSNLAQIQDSLFQANEAGANAGAIQADNNMAIITSDFTGNISHGNDGAGIGAGAVYGNGSVNIANTRFQRNQAKGGYNAGAIYVNNSDGGDSLRIANLLLEGNHTTGDGAAIYIDGINTAVYLVNNTIISGTLHSGSAVHVAAGTLQAGNNIIANHAVGLRNDLGRSVIEDYNFFAGNTTDLSGPIISSDPRNPNGPSHSITGTITTAAFTDFAGGDYHLTSVSVPLNKGGNFFQFPPVDYDMDTRPYAGLYDIGYDEAPYSPPTIVSDTVTIDEDTFAVVNPPANDFDPDGDDFKLLAVGTPMSGTMILSGTTVTYTPTLHFYGTDVITYAVQETSLSVSTGNITITVNPVNDAPVTFDKTITTTEDTAITISPLIDATDVESDTLSIVMVGSPAHGAAVISGSTQVVYTPTLNYAGSDNFAYSVSDGSLADFGAITVTVTPVNDPPVITAGNSISITMSEDGSPTPFNLTLHATDPDNAVLTWTVKTQANNGTATASGTGNSKIIGYAPTANRHGEDSFEVSVTDGTVADTIRVSMTVESVNDAPLAVDDTLMVRRDDNEELFILASQTITIPVMVNDNDRLDGVNDSSSLTLSAVGTGSRGGTVAINANNRWVDYTPTATFTGTEIFTYTVNDRTITYDTTSDDNGLTATATVTVTIVNGDAGDSTRPDNDDIKTIVIPNTGISDTITVTVQIPAGIANNDTFALIFNELEDLGGEVTPDLVPAGLVFTLDAYLNHVLQPGYVFPAPITLTIAYNDDDVPDTPLGEPSMEVRYWTGTKWSRDGITVVERDTVNNRLTVTVAHLTEFAFFGRDYLYYHLPIVTKNYSVEPDLVIDRLSANNDSITVTLRNYGNAPVTDNFWVDVYFDPTQTPELNKPWYKIAPAGAVWGVTATIPAGERLTLTVGDAYYHAERSSDSFPTTQMVYGYADSVNYNTTYGNVKERNEANNLWPGTGPLTLQEANSRSGHPSSDLPKR